MPIHWPKSTHMCGLRIKTQIRKQTAIPKSADGSRVTFIYLQKITLFLSHKHFITVRFWRYFIRPHRMHSMMRSIVTDVARSMICLSVCVSVCWWHECAVQKRLNRSRCHLKGNSCGSKEQCIGGQGRTKGARKNGDAAFRQNNLINHLLTQKSTFWCFALTHCTKKVIGLFGVAQLSIGLLKL